MDKGDKGNLGQNFWANPSSSPILKGSTWTRTKPTHLWSSWVRPNGSVGWGPDRPSQAQVWLRKFKPMPNPTQPEFGSWVDSVGLEFDPAQVAPFKHVPVVEHHTFSPLPEGYKIDGCDHHIHHEIKGQIRMKRGAPLALYLWKLRPISVIYSGKVHLW